MPAKKSTVASVKKAATPAPKKKKSAPKKKPLPRYMAVKNDIYHPFQKVRVTGYPGVILELDSWLECQLERGLVQPVKEL